MIGFLQFPMRLHSFWSLIFDNISKAYRKTITPDPYLAFFGLPVNSSLQHNHIAQAVSLCILLAKRIRVQDFDFSIVHKPGERNKVPGARSLACVHRALPPVMLTDRPHVRQLQLVDPVIDELLKDGRQDEEDSHGPPPVCNSGCIRSFRSPHNPKEQSVVYTQ